MVAFILEFGKRNAGGKMLAGPFYYNYTKWLNI